MSTSVTRALVFGGTGAVGSEVLRALHRKGIPAVFTYHRSQDKARALEAELPGSQGIAIDLADAPAVHAFVSALEPTPDLFVHCAAVSHLRALGDITDADWTLANAVNVQSAFVACRALAPKMVAKKFGSIVLIGALDRAQALPLPVHFAATQGALSALTMGLSKELGVDGIFVNQVTLGLLEGGMSAELGPQLAEDFKTFSALRRQGTAAEAAKAIIWLGLENTYISGKVIAVNGGI